MCVCVCVYMHTCMNDGFTGGTSVKEPAFLCRSYKVHGFILLIRKISCRNAWPHTPVSWP